MGSLAAAGSDSLPPRSDTVEVTRVLATSALGRFDTSRPSRPPRHIPDMDGRRRREAVRRQLRYQRKASTPRRQWADERAMQYRRLLKKRAKGAIPSYVNDLRAYSDESVRAAWQSEGLWQTSWDSRPTGASPLGGPRPGSHWKHEQAFLWLGPRIGENGVVEEPTEPEEELMDTIADLTGFRSPSLPPKEPCDHDGCKKVRQSWMEREASKPRQRFLAKIAEERLRIAADRSFDGRRMLEWRKLSALAYKNIKANWIYRGIWSRGWGAFPGSSWNHEKPERQFLLEEMGEEELLRLEAPRGATPPPSDNPIPPPPPIAAPSACINYWITPQAMGATLRRSPRIRARASVVCCGASTSPTQAYSPMTAPALTSRPVVPPRCVPMRVASTSRSTLVSRHGPTTRSSNPNASADLQPIHKVAETTPTRKSQRLQEPAASKAQTLVRASPRLAAAKPQGVIKKPLRASSRLAARKLQSMV